MKLNSVNVQQQHNISVVQFTTDFANSFKYISGADALKKGLVTISEVSEGGTVQKLYAINDGKEYVFFSDGDVLAGAKQNRVLQISILLEPKSKTIIPVNCVESGRWSYRTKSFEPSEVVLPAKLRGFKLDLINEEKTYMLQSELWEGIANYAIESNVHSNTQDFIEIAKKASNKHEKVVWTFKLNENANGLALFLNNEIYQVETFNRVEIYKKYFEKLVASFITSVFSKIDTSVDKIDMDFKEKLNSTLESISKSQKVQKKSAGAGKFYTFKNGYTGAELVFDGHLIHTVAILNSENRERNRKNIPIVDVIY